MTLENMLAARDQAWRFLEAVKAAIAEVGPDQFVVGTKLTGAARRASMDLTRALADLRRS